ncbi:MAG: DUF1559 domain-containing protein [Pirellula sp.]
MRKLKIVIAVIGCLLVAVWLASIVNRARHEAMRMGILGRLSQLHLGLSNYEILKGDLPKINLSQKDQTLRDHWMVSVLPIIEQSELHTKLKLDVRWSTPQNVDAAKSNRSFYEFATRFGYMVCPLIAEESIWHPVDGSPIGRIDDNPETILLVAIPSNEAEPFEVPFVTKAQLLGLLQEDQEVFYIRCDRKYGQVSEVAGKLMFVSKNTNR